MSSNLRIKQEAEFRKAYDTFQQAREKLQEQIVIFKEHTELKREWIDERSEKWHDVEENDQFNTYVQDVESYIDELEDLLTEIENLELPTNELT